ATGLTSAMTIEKLQRIGSSGSFVKTELPAKVGETVEYQVIVKNTGETKIGRATCRERKYTTIAGGKASLAPGESATWTCEHKLTATGKYTHAAAVKRTEDVTKEQTCALPIYATGLTSAMTIEKLQRIGSSGSFVKTELPAKVGETVEYQVIVKNTGET